MNALDELMLEIEKHAVLRAHASLTRRALEDLQSLRNNVAFYERETKRINARLEAAEKLAAAGENLNIDLTGAWHDRDWIEIRIGETRKFIAALEEYRKAVEQ